MHLAPYLSLHPGSVNTISVHVQMTHPNSSNTWHVYSLTPSPPLLFSSNAPHQPPSPLVISLVLSPLIKHHLPAHLLGRPIPRHQACFSMETFRSEATVSLSITPLKSLCSSPHKLHSGIHHYTQCLPTSPHPLSPSHVLTCLNPSSGHMHLSTHSIPLPK